MGKFNQNSILSFVVFLFFSANALSQILASGSVGDKLRYEPKLTLAIKGNCKNSVDTYQCLGGFKVAPTLLSKWKKTSQPGDYYEYEDKNSFITFAERGKLLSEFLDASCPSRTYGMYEMNSIRHCPDEQKKQAIMFTVKWPGWEILKKEHGHILICNAEGGTAWLKRVFPKAAWQEVHNLPHYYEYQAKSEEEAKELEKFIGVVAYEKELPAGCRYQDCELFKNVFDVCK